MRDGRYQLAVLVFIVSRPNNCKNAILLSFFVCLLLILEILTTMKSLHWYYCEGQTIILCCFVNELVLSFINKVSSCVHAFVIYVSCLVWSTISHVFTVKLWHIRTPWNVNVFLWAKECQWTTSEHFGYLMGFGWPSNLPHMKIHISFNHLWNKHRSSIVIHKYPLCKL